MVVYRIHVPHFAAVEISLVFKGHSGSLN
jgi:hypothetical protein